MAPGSLDQFGSNPSPHLATLPRLFLRGPPARFSCRPSQRVTPVLRAPACAVKTQLTEKGPASVHGGFCFRDVQRGFLNNCGLQVTLLRRWEPLAPAIQEWL